MRSKKIIKNKSKSLDALNTHSSKDKTCKTGKKDYERLFNFSMDMLCVAGFDGYFKELNPSWKKTLGWTKQELQSKPYLDFVHPEDRESTINAAKGLEEGKTVITFENRYLCKDGSYKWLSWNSFPQIKEKLIFAVARDITEQKIAEQELKRLHDDLEIDVQIRTTELRKRTEDLMKERAFTENALNSLKNVFFVFNLEGRFLRWNKAMNEVSGYNDEEISSMKPTDFFVGEDVGRIEKAIETVIKNGYGGVEAKVITKDGRFIPYEFTASLLKNHQGKPISISGVGRDITEHKEAQQKILYQSTLLGAINKVLQETLTSETEEQVARTCLALAEELTGSKFGFICEVNKAGLFDTIAISDPGWDACSIPITNALSKLKDLEIRGIRGRVIKEGRSMIFNDPASHSDFIEPPEGHPKITAFLGIPFKHAERIIGMIGLANKESGYREEDQYTIEALSAAFVGALMRKRAEVSLWKSEEQYRDLVDNALVGIYKMNLKGDFLYVNDALARLFEFDSRKEMMLESVLSRYKNPTDREPFLETLKKEGKVSNLELEMLTKKGNEISVLLSATLEGDILSGMVMDITERKRAEEELRRVNHALKTISECNQALVRITEEQTLLNEICKIMITLGGYKLAWVGYAEHDKKKTVRPVAYAGYEEGFLEKLHITWADTEYGRGPSGTAIRTGSPAIFNNISTDPAFAPWQEEALERGYASIIGLPLIVNSDTIGALTICAGELDAFHAEEVKLLTELANDLAYGIAALRIREEHKRVEEALKKSEEQLRLMIEGVKDYAIFMLDPDGYIVNWNAGAERIKGYKTEEIVGKHFSVFYLQEDIEQGNPKRELDDARREGRYEDEGWRLRKDGSRFWANVVTTALRDQQGNLKGFSKITRDITERKQAKEALQIKDWAIRSSINAIAINDLEGHIFYVNPSFLRMWGYEKQEQVLGRLPTDIAEEAAFIIDEIKEKGYWSGELLSKRNDGSILQVELSASIVKDANDKAICMMASFIDITERKKVEHQIKRKSILLEGINKVLLSALLSETDEELGKTCLAVAEEVTGSKFGFIGELNEKGLFDTIAISNPGWDECKVPQGQATLSIKNMPVSGVDRATMRDGKSRIVNGEDAIVTHPDHVRIPKGHPRITAFLGVPLKQEGKTIGMIGLGNKEGGYSIEDQENIEALSVAMVEAFNRRRAEKAIREAELRYRTVADFTYNWEYWEGHDGKLLYISPSCERITEYSPKEYIDNPSLIREIIISEDREIWDRHHHTKIGNQELRYEEIQFRIQTKQGKICWIEHVCQPVKGNQGEFLGIRSSNRDITTRKEAEQQIKRQIGHITALRNIDMAITSSLDLRVTLNVILEQAITQLNVDAAAVLLLNQHTQTLEYSASRGFHTSALKYTRLRLGEGHAGLAALERRIVHIPNLSEAENGLKRSPMLPNEGFTTYYAVPLIAKGHVKGVLEIFHRSSFDPDQEWLDFLESLTTQAAIAVDNASLFDDLQHSNVELVLAYDTTIEGWANALDLRDKETEGHSRRVTEMTVKIARMMGISETELVHIRRGALLHDIGKMGIPDRILQKPGKLDEEEWEIMHKHPVYAYELLYPITFLRPAIEIPYCHHEKWDGTGYPRGLKGEYIPLAARIFAAVDVWDALRSDRPYRPAWSEEKTKEYLLQEANKHFDPKVVEMFFKIDW